MDAYQSSLPHCLEACKCTFYQLTISLRKRVEHGGDEKLRHAEWLNNQMNGVELTAEQTAEIRYATIKYRPHKAKHDEWKAKQITPADSSTIQMPRTATIAEGAGSSSSGNAYVPFPQRTRSVPQRNPAHPYVGQPPGTFTLPHGPPPVRGQAKRVRDDGSISRTTGQVTDDPFIAMVHRERSPHVPAPTYLHNPNRDIRRDIPAHVPDDSHASVKRTVARKTDSLPWADRRAEQRLAADARTGTPSSIVYANEVAMPQVVWSQLEATYVRPSGPSSRITRSRSPAPRPRQYPDARHQGTSTILRSPSPMRSPPGRWEPCD